jgi:hypothetical protein
MSMWSAEARELLQSNPMPFGSASSSSPWRDVASRHQAASSESAAVSALSFASLDLDPSWLHHLACTDVAVSASSLFYSPSVQTSDEASRLVAVCLAELVNVLFTGCASGLRDLDEATEATVFPEAANNFESASASLSSSGPSSPSSGSSTSTAVPVISSTCAPGLSFEHFFSKHLRHTILRITRGRTRSLWQERAIARYWAPVQSSSINSQCVYEFYFYRTLNA